MEQKKTLWIIAAVGVFLLVVIGVVGLPFYLRKTNFISPNTSTYSVEKTVSSSGWTNSPDKTSNSTNQPVALPDNGNSKVSEMIVFADNATVYETAKKDSENQTTIDLNDLKRGFIEDSKNEVQPQNINITLNIPEPTKTVIETAPVTTTINKVEAPKEVAKVPVETPVVESTPAKTTSTSTVTKVTAKNTKTTAKSTKTAAAAPAPKAEPKKTQFWVQVAAYSNKKGAESARSVLDSNKIPADIFTYKDNKDKLFYRVRVGPYTTKSEAEYWRSRIVKIDDFSKAESYVTSTTN